MARLLWGGEMNLYKVMFEHYSQKDSAVGTVCYLLAKDTSEVYDYVKEMAYWEYAEEDFDAEYSEYDSFKEKILAIDGEMFDDEADFDDLYYGKTLYGWEIVKEDVNVESLAGAIKLGIVKEIK